jgi:formylglycine-generating enzyme required for sulfatase activity
VAPVANVAALEASLKGADFSVSTALNQTLDGFTKAKNAFLASVHPGDVVMIYYSGYAIQVKNDNFLLPVEYKPALPLAKVPYATPSLGRLVEETDEKKPAMKIVIVDAPWQVAVPAPPGLSAPDLSGTRETLVAFSNQPGQIVPAPAGDGPSPFTEKLAEIIRTPGVQLDDVFLTARREVSRMAASQLPYSLSNVTAAFYFRQPLEDKPAVTVKHLYKRNRRDRQEYVFIPPGSFQMGCVPGDTQCEDNERPQHQVTISKGFWLGSAEVDILAYKRYVGDDKSRKMPGEAPEWDKKRQVTNHPIGGATWDEAAAFCKWAGGRLPTEAEWEHAARAGKKNEIWPLNDENSRDKANFYGKKGNDLFEYTAAVKSFDPNGFGLFDMAGNMWEWVSDWYSDKYYSSSPERDPQGPSAGKKHVKRGGSFDSDPKKHLRISIRRPADRGNNVGFRCVLENTPQIERLFEPQ